MSTTIYKSIHNTLFKTKNGDNVNLLFTITAEADGSYLSHIDTQINGLSSYNRRPARHTSFDEALAARKERLARTDKSMAEKAAKHNGVWPVAA